ncbi:MAG: hypothetical protein KF865_02870 [Bdellovibrionaceae bacterium]|nr:hypothetical protein [Pseudobdellovibrionaceae bacterium]
MKRLETAYREILKSGDLSREGEAVKVLAELIQEQVQNEDPRSSARPVG